MSQLDSERTRMKIKFWQRVEILSPNACWYWNGKIATDGYGRFYFEDKELIVHRIAFMLHNDTELDRKTLVLHSCKNKTCCNPKHLYTETKKQHLETMAEEGRIKGFAQRGEKNKHAKLTNEQAKEAKKLFASGEFSKIQLAKIFNVSQSAISELLNKVWWKWMK